MGGVLPRKTFSMGHAEEKRYYVECRNITEDASQSKPDCFASSPKGELFGMCTKGILLVKAPSSGELASEREPERVCVPNESHEK